MVAVPLGAATYRRQNMHTPEVELTNLLVEADPTNQVDGKVRFQRPALVQFGTIGIAGPIRGVFRRYGVVGSQYIVVASTYVYTVSEAGLQTLLGVITGTDLASIDGGPTKAIIVANGIAYWTTGVGLTAVTMPLGEDVSCVLYIGGYFLLFCADSQRFYWLAPGDTNPDPLNFASAETSPDNIVKGARLLDEVWIFGQQSTEVWQLTGDLNAPFQPVGGRLYEKGCANKDTVYVLDNTLFWVGNDLIVYRAGTTPERISTHSIEEHLQRAGALDLRAWAFSIDGHTLYCIRMGDEGSWSFDVENQNWPRFKSYGQETWRAHVGTQVDGATVIAGDDTTNTLYQLDSSVSNDNGEAIERIITGGVALVGKPQVCRDFSLVMAVGWASITGDATNPIILLSFSDDGGNTWSSWIEQNLGLQGHYSTEVVWRQLGLMVSPGRLFRIKVTDDVPVRISYARINEAVSI
jgi:hypothetical protein